MSPMGIVKFIGAWGCIIASAAFLVIGGGNAGLSGTLALLGVAFSLAPETA